MDSTQLLKGVLDIAVLAALEHEDGYGYDIMRRLREAGFEDIGDATVYGTLRRLYTAGSLTTYVVPSDDGPNRKYYSINDTGLNELTLGRLTWNEFTKNMSAVLGKKPKGSN